MRQLKHKPKIHVKIFRNKSGDIFGFQADDHGDAIVCAAVSALALNTVNSVETLTDERFTCEYDDEGGYLVFMLPDIENGKHNHDVNLLLNAFALGLAGIERDYPQHIQMRDNQAETKP